MTEPYRHALVFGATGFVGRNLILALDRAGVRVSAASRGQRSYQQLCQWLSEHGHERLPADVRVDFESPALLAGAATGGVANDGVTEIYNCAGAYRFGMSPAEAHHANVDSVRAVVGFAAKLPRLRRLVQVSGYRVGGQDPSLVPWDEERRRRAYHELGAYEASKVEADAVFQSTANQLGVSWTIVNPACVIGDSLTGESDQLVGLAATLKELWQGTLAALPGDGKTFVPVVAVDYLARFMTAVPVDEASQRRAYWVLDDQTPALRDLLGLVAEHYQVKAPRLRIPVGLLKSLPRQLTKADPETLTFLSTDRYPTASADEFAARHGIRKPDCATTVRRWADYLAAHRFGATATGARRFTTLGGSRTFERGEPDAPTVLLPGLPINADSWSEVAEALGGTRIVDLPGLGLSGPPGRSVSPWLSALVEPPATRHLVGHSLGAAMAVEAASAHPDRIESLTVVSPFFLQGRPGLPLRVKPLTTWYFRHTRPDALARQLTGDPAVGQALTPSVEDLRRGGVAAEVARLLARTASVRWRTELQTKLKNYPGPVHVVVGGHDPLAPAGRALVESLPGATMSTIAGAGHHPQLTHPQAVAEALARYTLTPR